MGRLKRLFGKVIPQGNRQEKLKQNKNEASLQEENPISFLERTLRERGITATTAEIEEIVERVSKKLDFQVSLAEEMMLSYSAELKCTESGYIIFTCIKLLNGAGNLSQDILKKIMALAVYYASVSEIAKAKGFSDFSIKKDQRIALCDFRGGGSSTHPIHNLFPTKSNLS